MNSIANRKPTMVEYYHNLVEKNLSDKIANGVHIFQIGQGDVHLYPELLSVDQLWVYKGGRIQLLHIEAIQNYCPPQGTYEYN